MAGAIGSLEGWWDLFGAHAGARLWHYTSAEAARKIVDSGVLRLGSSRFMNDPDEGKLATELVEPAARERRESEGWEPTALAAMWPGMQRTTEDLFLASFGVQEGPLDPRACGVRKPDGADSLSQWAMYANDAKGVALVFEIARDPEAPIFEVEHKSAALERVDGRIQSFTHRCIARFCRVKYWCQDAGQISKWIRREFDREWISSVDALAFRQSSIEQTLRPMVKSDFYAQEHECRLVAPVPTSLASDGSLTEAKPIKFTEDGKPFLEYHWADSLRLVEYWLGPRSSANDVAATRLFLDQLGHTQVQVRKSGGAYRGRG